MAMSPPKTDDEVPPQRTPMTVITDPYCPTMSELYVVPGVVVVERFFTVPLDYRNESRGTIQIFARHCIQLARHKQMEQLPFMVYLQGGPGMEASSQPPSNSGMLKVLMDRGYQVLLLDQRGTGLSTPISGRTLADIGTLEEQVEYVKLFRADNIVRDCEALRTMLTAQREDKRWSILGQSFGGFASVTYLSFAPASLREVYITGGLPPMVSSPDDVYMRLFHKVVERNRSFYAKYPYDGNRVRDILSYLTLVPTTTPNGGYLSTQRFQQLGLDFGAHGGFDRVHNLILRTSNDLNLFQKITYKTLSLIQESNTFDSNVLYAILHEPIYCQGEASNWSADRIMTSRFQDFFWPPTTREAALFPPLFTGEMIFPWMFRDYAELRPLAQLAGLLAKEKDWPELYDFEQLAKNDVAVAAATYVEDMYVDYEMSKETKEKIRGCQQWITNKYLHNGLRQDPAEVLGTLFNIIVNGTPH